MGNDQGKVMRWIKFSKGNYDTWVVDVPWELCSCSESPERIYRRNCSWSPDTLKGKVSRKYICPSFRQSIQGWFFSFVTHSLRKVGLKEESVSPEKLGLLRKGAYSNDDIGKSRQALLIGYCLGSCRWATHSCRSKNLNQRVHELL